MSDDQYAFLENEAPDEPAEVAATPEPETVEVTPEPPAPVVPTTAEPLEATHVPLAALKAEREKRQQYERELQAIRQQQAQYQQQQQAPEPNFYEAPEQFVHQAVQRERQQMTQVFYAALEAQARETYADYDEVFAELTEHAQANPAVVPQIMQSPNPATAAYRFGKQLREMKAMQDPQAYRQKIEAEVRASIAAEQTAKETARAAQAAAIPPDLSAARSSRDQEIVPDDSLDSILASRKPR